ncbi:DUF1482 family protein [Cronobacter muytjensii]|uniref:DUF1482 family protein n=1 Tax=Cronobacter muytjensii TaxID=413501 RepID=UPI00398B3B9D
MTQLFALVFLLCSSNSGEDCADAVIGVYDTEAECRQVIFDERYFNASCYPVDKIIHQEDLPVASN